MKEFLLYLIGRDVFCSCHVCEEFLNAFRTSWAGAMFKTNLAGAQIVQTVGPFRQVLTFESEKSAEVPRQRFLLVTAADSGTPELIERVP